MIPESRVLTRLLSVGTGHFIFDSAVGQLPQNTVQLLSDIVCASCSKVKALSHLSEHLQEKRPQFSVSVNHKSVIFV